MNWYSKLPNLLISISTLVEKLGNLSSRVDCLASDLNNVNCKVCQLQGAFFNSSNPELLRQLSEANKRLANLETRLAILEETEARENKLLTLAGKLANQKSMG